LILTLLLLALSTLVSIIITYLVALDVVAGNHIVWALGSVTFGLFTLSIHLFYFIGTGSDVKKLLAEKAVDEELQREILAETRLFKMRTSPALTVAMLLLMTTFVMGGAVGVGMLDPIIHQIVATLAIVATGVALVVTHVMVRRNYILLVRVGSILSG
jgi:hypothetical protein